MSGKGEESTLGHEVEKPVEDQSAVVDSVKAETEAGPVAASAESVAPITKQQDDKAAVSEKVKEKEESADATEKADDAVKPAEKSDAAAEESKAVEKSGDKSEKPVGEKSDGTGRRKGRGNKSDFSSLPESKDHDEIRKQVEFYFSDSNLVQDKFLLDLVGGSQNKPIPLSVIHSFKRMRHFQPYSEVVAALQKSEVLNISDKDELTRKEALPSTVGKEVNRDTVKIYSDRAQPRSIYAKGFGEETTTLQLDIEKFFEPFGPLNAIRLRRHKDNNFKGSVFVEFKQEAKQKAFLALETKPKFNSRELLIMSKKAYVEMKADDIRAGKIQPSERTHHEGRNGKSGDWKERRDNFQKNGYKGGNDRHQGRGGRGGRGGGRGGSHGRDSRQNGGQRNRSPPPKKPDVDEHGIPIVHAVERKSKSKSPKSKDDSPEAKKSGKVEEKDTAAAKTEVESPGAKKRTREEDGGKTEEELPTTKKTKVDEEAASA